MTALLVCFVVLVIAAGCSNKSEKELVYRSGFKRIWDRTMTRTEEARKAIDKAYSDGNIGAAVTEYRKLGKYYASSREATRKLKEPEGYGTLQKLALAYFAEGAEYYDSVGQVVEDSGGNYNVEQEKTIKAKEKIWNESTEDLRKALKAKRFALK